MILLLKNLLFTVLVPGVVAVYVPVFVLDHESITLTPASAPALLFLLAGVAIYAWCVWDFAVLGRGTPAPIDAPKTLVVRGLYKFSRNPMYVGVLTTILGWAMLFRESGIVIYAGVVAVFFHLMVIVYEEPHLGRLFGSSYTEYRANVNRWLPLPRAKK